MSNIPIPSEDQLGNKWEETRYLESGHRMVCYTLRGAAGVRCVVYDPDGRLTKTYLRDSVDDCERAFTDDIGQGRV